MKQIHQIIVFGLAFALLVLASCGGDTATNTTQEGDKKLNIVATTGMIKDALANIVGDKAEVVALMGSGVDPHLYKATQSDLQKITSADIVFYNGLYLEGKMEEIFKKLQRQKTVVAVGEGLDTARLIRVAEGATAHAYDPHIWFDVDLWANAVTYMGEALQKKDVANATIYQENTEKYVAMLKTVHEKTKVRMATIPKQQRVLITSHDAFGYFGKAYDIEVTGLQGLSTVSEYGLRDITEMVKRIIDRGIKSVFIESSVPAKSIEAVVEGCQTKGHEVSIGGELYSDAMGADGTPEGTYIGMVNANVSKIVNALK